jgi:4-hydroxybenzoate polyprenyltransferase
MFNGAVETGRLLSKSSRPQNVVYSGLLAVLLAHIQHASILRTAACYLLIVMLYAVAASINNISDIETDKLNKRTDNPLVETAIRRQVLVVFICVCLVGIVLLQLGLKQPQSTWISVAYLILSYAYSDSFFNIKSRGLLGTVLLCICYSTLPIVLGASQGSIIRPDLIMELALFSACSLAPLILAKDYKDYKGDKLTHKMTPLVQFGVKRLMLITNCLLLITAAAYLLLALKYKTNMAIVLIGVLLYLALTRKLHLGQGNVPRQYKAALLLLLIAMPASIIF